MKTSTIQLRVVSEQDADLVMKWENNPEFWPHSLHSGPFTKSEVLEFINTCNDLLKHNQCRYMIIHHEEGEIGALDIFELDTLNKTAGIGILIADSQHRRKGMASAAILQFLQQAETKRMLRMVWCLVSISNLPSMALFEKCGFTVSGKKLFNGKETLRYVRYL